jgi:myo-inositol-1(or 4)-monophosphatase
LGVWDFAAGAIILTEAGGRLTDVDGKQLTFDRKSSVFAAAAGILQEHYLPLPVPV